MRLIAHRGFAATAPENTLQAVTEAAEVADGVEVDVRRCGSGELVVIHDETVDRVTDASGPVSSFTRTDLDALDVLDTGEGVPTLAAVLEAVPAHIGITLDLKESGIAADAVALLSETRQQVTLSSRSREVLAACRDAAPELPRAYITDGSDESGTDAVEVAIDLDCAFLHPSLDVATERVVAEAHRAGMSVNAWTVDTPADAETLAERGVDGVIADRPVALPESRQ